MYEQVSRGIQPICCLAAASFKFISFATFFLWPSTELVSILILIFHLQSTLLLTQNYLILSCQCATSPKFVAITGFKLKLSIILMETISLQSCGYYFWSCGYGIILWIVDIIYFKLNFCRALEPRWYKMHWARLERLRMIRIWKYFVDRSVDTSFYANED